MNHLQIGYMNFSRNGRIASGAEVFWCTLMLYIICAFFYVGSYLVGTTKGTSHLKSKSPPFSLFILLLLNYAFLELHPVLESIIFFFIIKIWQDPEAAAVRAARVATEAIGDPPKMRDSCSLWSSTVLRIGIL